MKRTIKGTMAPAAGILAAAWLLAAGCSGSGTDSKTTGSGTKAVAPAGVAVVRIINADGDDGDLQKGAAWLSPRFTDNTNGTVTDNLTGLIWLKNANCFGIKTWAAALTSANSLASEACGLSDGSVAGDWRLPNRKELQSLIDRSQSNPTLPSGHPFGTSVQSNYYWSSSSYAPNTNLAWVVFMLDGLVSLDGKDVNGYVWPLRAGQ